MPLKGYKLSDEHKREISIGLKKFRAKNPNFRKNKNNPLFGKHHTEETKKKISNSNKKENHWNWQGGKAKSTKGYFLIYSLTHPFRDKQNYIYEHRLVVEQQIGRYLLPNEICHHIGIKYLLNSIENKQHNIPQNLMVFVSKSAHHRFHHNPLTVKPEEIIFDGRKL